MKLRYKILYMSFGAGLVVLGMILNSLVSGDAEAQGGVKDAEFGFITCRSLIIKDGYKDRGRFGVSSSGDAILTIFGDDGKSTTAYLGANKAEHDEMMFRLQSKSKTDKREAMMQINGNGGRFDSKNKMGENVIVSAVGDDGGGLVATYDKFGYVKEGLGAK